MKHTIQIFFLIALFCGSYSMPSSSSHKNDEEELILTWTKKDEAPSDDELTITWTKGESVNLGKVSIDGYKQLTYGILLPNKTLILHVIKHNADFIIDNYDKIKVGTTRTLTQHKSKSGYYFMGSSANNHYIVVNKGSSLKNVTAFNTMNNKHVYLGDGKNELNLYVPEGYQEKNLSKLQDASILSDGVIIKDNLGLNLIFFNKGKLLVPGKDSIVSSLFYDDLFIYDPMDNMTYIFEDYSKIEDETHKECIDLPINPKPDYVVWKSFKINGEIYYAIFRKGENIVQDCTFDVSKTGGKHIKIKHNITGEYYYLIPNRDGKHEWRVGYRFMQKK